NEGIFVEPASAAPIAGLFNFKDKIPPNSRIVCTVTGHGLKDPDIAMKQFEELKPVAATKDDVLRALGI
ncbi:MAG TPA: hypothetical protein VJT50_02025, partial [Pyrinomonadaceae bacterium]|nr:hypothetical protein [Pyrinomonadaceae bacterium]